MRLLSLVWLIALSAALAAVAPGSLAAQAPAPGPPQNVVLDGQSAGKVFDGIGATSASTSYLLYDYPEPQRTEVLDYLFKPNFGAALQVLKIEVGGEGNSTIVSEPTHMRAPDEQNFERGYEWWLAREAVDRNPAIKVVALAWSFPRWVRDPKNRFKIDPAKAADYLTKFAVGAKHVHHIDLYCMGAWNETEVSGAFIKALKRRLIAAGLTTKVCGDDTFGWKIIGRMEADPELRDAMDVITNHYPKGKVAADVQAKAKRWNKPIWSSEDGPWVEEWNSNGDFSAPFAMVLNRNYIDGGLTSTNIWALITSFYDHGPILHAGLMRAQTPWSGHYEVESPIWAIAHTTQFAEPGWRYIDSGSARIKGGGSLVTLHDGAQYSIVVETMQRTRPTTLRFNVTGGLSTGPLTIWRSNAISAFERIGTIAPANGQFSITFDPASVYSLTTTSGQHKGVTTPPPEAPFPIPFRADFDHLEPGRTPPPFFAVINGAYDVVACPGGRTGLCVRQVLGHYPVLWTNGKGSPWILPTKAIPPTATPVIFGDARWRNYKVSADVFIEQAGEASLIGRLTNIDGAGVFIGYRFRLYASGRWMLHGDSRDGKPIATGQDRPSLRVWRHLELAMRGSRLIGRIDGKQVFAITDTSQGAGMAGIGTQWNRASFDNVAVDPVADTVPVIAPVPPRPPRRPPDPVVDLFIPTPGDRLVVLNWKAVPGADGYRLRWGTDPKKLTHTSTLGKTTHWVVDGLENDKTYHFVLAAFNAKGEGDRSYVQAGTPEPF